MPMSLNDYRENSHDQVHQQERLDSADRCQDGSAPNPATGNPEAGT